MCLKTKAEDGQKAQDCAFFKCGAQQRFPYRGYATDIRVVSQSMTMTGVAVCSIQTPFPASSEPSFGNLFEFHVPGKSHHEVGAVLTVSRPVYEGAGADLRRIRTIVERA